MHKYKVFHNITNCASLTGFRFPVLSHRHVAKSVRVQSPNSVHPSASTVKDCLQLKLKFRFQDMQEENRRGTNRLIDDESGQFPPRRVCRITPEATPCAGPC